jgi:hypothetical protein
MKFEGKDPTKYMMSGTQTKVFQKASYYYNHRKPEDMSRIYET